MATSAATSSSNRNHREATDTVCELRGRLESLLTLSRLQLQALDRGEVGEFESLIEQRQQIINEIASMPAKSTDSDRLPREVSELFTQLTAHDRYLAGRLEEGLRQVEARLRVVRNSRHAGKAYGERLTAHRINSLR